MLVAAGIGGGAFGDPAAGGLFRLGAAGFHRIDRLGTTGLAVGPGGGQLVRLLAGHERPQAPGHMLIYDREGVRHLHRVDELHDAHGVAWGSDGSIVAVSTATNAVLWLDEAGRILRRWDAPGDGDAWHLNCPELQGDDLVVSAFCQGDAHLGWREAVRTGTATGVVVRPAGGAGSVVLSGFCAPHDPTRLEDGTWLVNDSGRGAVLHVDGDGTVLERAEVGGWTRGLAVRDGVVHVGVSRRRHSDEEAEPGAVVALTLDGLVEIERWAVPTPELFSLVWVTPELLCGLEAGFGMAVESPGPATTTSVAGAPLMLEARRARVAVGSVPSTAVAGSWLAIRYELCNLGSEPFSAVGQYPVRLGAAWVGAVGEPVGDEARGELAAAVLPGETVAGVLRVPVPPEAGPARLRVGVLQEDVAWFSSGQDVAWFDVGVTRRGPGGSNRSLRRAPGP